jgi:N4-(beta-N-acetylglucosaminyl)-L-asparaginase
MRDMFTRRTFLQQVTAASGFAFAPSLLESNKPQKGPICIATWGANTKATAKAWTILEQGGYALDAVEQGIHIPEADPDDSSVGYGGNPDRDGNVTLDACIMNEKGGAGSVTFLQNIKHPISVARKVMEQSPHVILSGEGAQRFALDNGFVKENLLTEKAKINWENWLKTSNYNPIIGPQMHDTIGLLAIDGKNNICGGCSTSGAAYKMHGRVGDSPIIGAGLFVDNQIGAATCTGLGELMLKTLSSFLIVEMMRQGKHPQKACEIAVKRIVEKYGTDFQAGFVALDKKGNYGAYSILPNFDIALSTKEGTKKIKANCYKS